MREVAVMSGHDAPQMRRRIAIFVSHPIQYYAPWFRHLATRHDVEVFYALRQDAAGQARAGFGTAFEWDTPVLEGYEHRFLRNVAARPSLDTFGGCDTPEVDTVLADGRFDAAIIFGWNRKSSVQAAYAARRIGVPVFMRGDSQLETERSWLTRTAKFLPYRALLPLAAGHLYVGARNRAYLRHYGVPEEKLFFVPHCVDTELFADAAAGARESAAPAEIRSALGLGADAFVCGYVGKLLPKKRPLDLVRAVASLREKDVHAVLVGDGPLRREVEKLAQAVPGHVHLLGFRNQSELPAHYGALDCLVLSSDAGETWGLVVNEAMACGVPAIVSDAAGCGPDLIEEGVTGFTYSMGNVEELSERIAALRDLLQTRKARMLQSLARKTSAHSLASATAGLEHALNATIGS